MRNVLIEITRIFFYMGCVAFGGPVAHIALMEEELVHKRQWMTHEHFLDMLGATHLIPGPNSTEMALHCGMTRGGFPGMILAGLAFIIPAAVITLILAYIYNLSQNIPNLEIYLTGIRAAVLVIMFNALLRLGQKAVKSRIHIMCFFVATILTVCGMHPILILVLAVGIGVGEWYLTQKVMHKKYVFIIPFLLASGVHSISEKVVTDFSLKEMAFVFLKTGAILFGSGYVLVVYLQNDLVNRLGWMSSNELMDAIAIGQLTPGPVLCTATFIGYQLHGVMGAVIATFCIFLPSFCFVAILNPFIGRMRQSPLLSRVLDAVNATVVGLMLGIVVLFALNLSPRILSLSIVVFCFLMTHFMPKIPSPLLILMGGLLGWGAQSAFSTFFG